MNIQEHSLGIVIQGSLSQGLEVKLNSDISVEQMRVGKFLVVQGSESRFFSLVTNISLGITNSRIFSNPPSFQDTLMIDILAGRTIYSTIEITPMLMLAPTKQDTKNIDTNLELLPVKTVPSHFSPVYEASEKDFRTVFGWEDDDTCNNFMIGKPLDMNVPICINLDKFIERSNGIFGKSGTGKSFLTKLLIAGIIKKRAAVNLMFDMHSEYGWEAIKEGKKFSTVKGLCQLFPGQVEIFTLDSQSTKRRGVIDAQELYLSYDQIDIEDIRLVGQELGISEASLDNANILEAEYGKSWITQLLSMTNEEIKLFCQDKQGHAGSIMSLQRKLMRLENLKYLKNICPHNYINQILASLDAGKHVVIEFGSQSNMLSYMLATNMITRRIHNSYVKKAENFLQTKNPLNRPKQLVITIEEAHRFLDSKIVHQTIFGTIAREMRKYFVTLLIVDQRPSGIDNEVMSQIGTRITCLLNDEKDIDAIFTGVSGGQNLRSVLAKLDSKQQVLILGHAVPMPVVVKTRTYDKEFYSQIGNTNWKEVSNEEVFNTAKIARSELGF